MGSLGECKIEGFICRLCSSIDGNVIHIYSDEGEWNLDEIPSNNFHIQQNISGLMKKLEQKINVYLKINVSLHMT